MTHVRYGASALAHVLALAFAGPASATIVTLGDQDFADGALLNSVVMFRAPQSGEPAPVGTFIGSDFGPSGSTSFTFGFTPGAALSGAITFGIYDHDSKAAGTQVSSFTVDGVDLTATLNALFESRGGRHAEVNVYSLGLTGAALTALSDGSATFTLALNGPGLQGTPGSIGSTTPFNGFGLDFAQLDVRVAPVPEPETYALMFAGLGLLGLYAAPSRVRGSRIRPQ